MITDLAPLFVVVKSCFIDGVISHRQQRVNCPRHITIVAITEYRERNVQLFVIYLQDENVKQTAATSWRNAPAFIRLSDESGDSAPINTCHGQRSATDGISYYGAQRRCFLFLLNCRRSSDAFIGARRYYIARYRCHHRRRYRQHR